MKIIIAVFLTILCYSKAFSLNIKQITISSVPDNSINISLDTEATELYYFHSWEYEILQNTINLKVTYVSGFGSTIDYLNNNFAIPLNDNNTAIYRLNVKIYYSEEQLQDETEIVFTAPVTAPVYLDNPVFEIGKHLIPTAYPNPFTKEFFIHSIVERRTVYTIYDQFGKEVLSGINNENQIIDTGDLASGAYFLYLKDYEKTIKIVKR